MSGGAGPRRHDRRPPERTHRATTPEPRALPALLRAGGAFRAALGIPTDRTLQVLRLDEAGVVRWRAEGAYTDAAGADLATAVARLAGPDDR